MGWGAEENEELGHCEEREKKLTRKCLPGGVEVGNHEFTAAPFCGVFSRTQHIETRRLAGSRV